VRVTVHRDGVSLENTQGTLLVRFQEIREVTPTRLEHGDGDGSGNGVGDGDGDDL
jgi:hypothetical protein